MGLGSANDVPLADARDKAAEARRIIAQGINPIESRKSAGGIPNFGEMADSVCAALAAGFRNEKHKAQWRMTLSTYAAPLRVRPVDTVTTEDVLAVLKPISSAWERRKFDWREMQRWEISESRLPPGSEIYFRSPTIWEQHRYSLLGILAAVLIQALVILWLLYEHRRRHVAEVLARSTMAELHNVNRLAAAGELSDLRVGTARQTDRRDFTSILECKFASRA